MAECSVSCLSTLPSEQPAIDAVRCLFPEERVTVRDLIERAVREQCKTLSTRFAADLARAAQQMARQYLTADEIAQSRATGRVALREPAAKGAPALDVNAEIRRACQAFSDRNLMIVVGDARCESLDQAVTLGIERPVQFVRMVPLIGG